MSLKAKKLQNTTIAFLFLAPVSILFYSVYVFNPGNADNLFLYFLMLLADIIGMIIVLSLWLTILMDVLVPEHHSQSNNLVKTSSKAVKPHVDILITVAGEPLEIVSKTVKATLKIEYPHHTFVLDDGNSKEIKSLANQLGVKYIARGSREFAKAGNLNHGLLHSDAEFFAILDADQVPKPDFLDKLMAQMNQPDVAMVQAPQHYINTQSFIASGSSLSQEIFYKYILPARNISNSVFCVGTNVVFRRSAIDQIGGIASLDHSEDIWTSYMLHQKGWKSLFVNQILTEGLAPDTIHAYFRQQLRWAKGGFTMFFYKNPMLAKELSLDQRIQYFCSNFFYFAGITMFLYTLFPILYLLFGIKPLDTSNGLVWLIHYLPYLGLYYSLNWLLLGKMYISVLSVSIATFYPYMLALFSTLFGMQQQWVATSAKKRGLSVVMSWIWPHVFLILLSIFSLFVGWYYPSDFWVTAFYSSLALWNMYLLLIFISGNPKQLSQPVAKHKPKTEINVQPNLRFSSKLNLGKL